MKEDEIAENVVNWLRNKAAENNAKANTLEMKVNSKEKSEKPRSVGRPSVVTKEKDGTYSCKICNQSLGTPVPKKLADDINKLEIYIKKFARETTTHKHYYKKKDENEALKKEAEDLIEINKGLKRKLNVLTEKNQNLLSADKKQQINELLLKQFTFRNDENVSNENVGFETPIQRHRRKCKKQEAEWRNTVEVLPKINKDLKNVIDWMEKAAAATRWN